MQKRDQHGVFLHHIDLMGVERFIEQGFFHLENDIGFVIHLLCIRTDEGTRAVVLVIGHKHPGTGI